MRIISKDPNQRDIEKLKDLLSNVNVSIHSFAKHVDQLQREVAELFIYEFGVSGSIDLQSLSKLARITSQFASSESSHELGKYQKLVQKLDNAWQSLRKEDLSSRERTRYAIIPAKLCFFYFYNGELNKAVVCLLDYIDLIPEDALSMEAGLRWLMFLGETELAEKKMKKWKMHDNSADIFEATRISINYLTISDNRPNSLQELIQLRDRIKSENIRSFPKYELASYVSWLCSTLSNVSVGSSLIQYDFPDRMSQVQEASSKAESIIRNRVPGLAAYQFDNSVSALISQFLDENQGNSTDYIHLGSSLAWHFEMRRESALVNVSSAQTRDSISAMILNLRVALKSASLFRILQMTNLLAYYTGLVEEVGSEKNAKLMKISCVNLLSSNPILVRCSTPKASKVPSRAHTPLPGEKSGSRSPKSDTMIETLTQNVEELDLYDDQMFHPITRTCICNVCVHYPLSTTFAAEYMMAYCIHSDFTQVSMKHFNDEFIQIRERGMNCQTMMHRDRSVRPRPNIIQNEVFGLCVIRWLSKKIDAKEYVDPESLEIFKNALKIVKYLNLRTTDLLLAVQQLGRQLEFPQDCNYSWMHPVERKTRIKPLIGNAIDLFRAVSPFGRRPRQYSKGKQQPFDKQRYQKVSKEMHREMTNYAHILYREWRSRLFPYIGRTSEDPWLAAYAWAESTLIGSRNAIQCRLTKCRTGVVTISGRDRFKKCVEAMPDDMTLVQIAMGDDKNIYLIKLHADRDPVIMPIAHQTHAIELMEKFSLMLEEDERIAKYPGEMTPDEFWTRRKVVDARMKQFVQEVQDNFLDVAAFLLMPSERLGTTASEMAEKICKLSKGGLLLGEAKETVSLAEKMDREAWNKLIIRFCEMRNTDEEFVSFLPTFHGKCLDALFKDKSMARLTTDSEKKYTYLVICPHLSQFCWERLPIFEEYPYIVRQVSIHSIFSQLEAMRNQEKQIPLQIDVQNAYYVLDPENNLGETKKRMLDYINKFKWEGTVGEAPSSTDITTALSKRDAFFYFGHGSGSSVMPRSVIKQSTCNAISMLMGCGSVRTIPQAPGFDGKSALHDYAMAKCPLIVGCLWTVTDGEIDRFLIRMIDDCFEKTKAVSGVDKLRQLSEAMHEARLKAKLKYLTGAAVVMYGLPVVSKPKVTKEDFCETPGRSRRTSSKITPSRKESTSDQAKILAKDPGQDRLTLPLRVSRTTNQASTPKRTGSNSRSSRNDMASTSPEMSENVPVSRLPSRQTKTFPEESVMDEELPKRSSRLSKPATIPSTSRVPTKASRSNSKNPSRLHQL